MTFKVAIDNGHGKNTAGKRTPKFSDGTQMREWEFNYTTAKYLKSELEKCGISTVMLSDTEIDTPLATRSKKANSVKVDLVISIHANALKDNVWGTHGGTELHVYKKGNIAEKYAKEMLKQITSNSCKGFRNRGIWYSNLHMVRETNAPAVLCEALFMDNLEEAKKLKSDNFRRQYAKDIAKAICKIEGITYKETSSNTQSSTKKTYYRVICGSYTDKANAEAMQNKLKKAGFDSFLEAVSK